jgi:hypothetical protein
MACATSTCALARKGAGIDPPGWKHRLYVRQDACRYRSSHSGFVLFNPPTSCYSRTIPMRPNTELTASHA